MKQEKRQKVLLGLLLLVLALGAVRYVPGWLSGGEAGPTRRGGGDDGLGAAEGVEVATLDLEALAGVPRDYEPGRNPFQYYQPPPPKPVGPTPEELARRAEEERRRQAALREQQQQHAEAQPPPPPPKPQPPSFQLTYLGSFGPESRRIAVFTDGDEIYNALIGDVIEDKFIISDIGFESVSITYVGFPDEPAKRVAVGG